MALIATMALGQIPKSDDRIVTEKECLSLQQRQRDSIFYQQNGIVIKYETFRDNCILMRFLSIPDGISFYCPLRYSGRRCNIYVLKYKKVYKFGELFKSETPDTIDCLYENGLLKTINYGRYVDIFKYYNDYRLADYTRYSADGRFEHGRHFYYGWSDRPDKDIIIKGKSSDSPDPSSYYTLYVLNQYDKSEYRGTSSEDDDYGLMVCCTKYRYNTNPNTVSYEHYCQYKSLTKRGKKWRSTSTHYDEKRTTYYYTPIGANKTDDIYIYEYEIHE